MGQFDAYEGKTIVGPDGTHYTVKGGQMLDPSGNVHTPQEAAAPENDTTVSQDVKAGAVPWLARGVEDVAGMPGAMVDLAGAGLKGASNYIPSFMGGDSVASAGNYLRNSGVAKNWGPEGWAKGGSIIPGGDSLVQGMGFDPNYQPQTKTGKFVRTGLEFAPATLASIPFGPEAMAATLARGGGAALASEGLGQAVESYTGENSKEGAAARMVGALLGGHVAPKAITPFPAASQARVTAADQLAQDIKPFGGRVDAAQRTGSSTLRNLTGEGPNNDEAVTRMLLDKGKVPYQANQPVAPAIAAAAKTAGQDLNTARNNAWMVRDNQFWNTLQSIEADAKATYPKGSKQLQEVDDALKQARTPSQGTGNQRRVGQISGKDYVSMKNQMLGSKNPHVNQLGAALEEAGQRTPGAPWMDIDQRSADAMRLGSAARAGGPFGTSLNPTAVANALGKKGEAIRTATPMTEAAQRASDVLAPIPAQQSPFAKALIPTVGAAAGFMLPGSEHMSGAILGSILGSEAHPALTAARQRILQSRPAQKYLGNQALLPGRDYQRLRDAKLQRALIGGPLDQPYLDADKQVP